MEFTKNQSISFKITLTTVLVVLTGFIILIAASIKYTQTKVTETLVDQFINENTQIAKQVSIILENGGTTDDLQKFVEEKVSGQNYFAYAVIIDTEVKAIAHSDQDKIGKSYTDDTSYTVPAATKGTVMTSQFWANVQDSWTYDVMCPIYVDGKLYGSMDVGIYNSQLSSVIHNITTIAIAISIAVLLIIAILVFIVCRMTLRPFSKLIEVCNSIGDGDFSVTIDEKMLRKNDEIGKMANSMVSMKQNLSNLILITTQNANMLLEISENLHHSAINTQSKAEYIASRSNDDVISTEKQTELATKNTQMTEDIARVMEDIAENIITVTTASTATVNEAQTGSSKINVVVHQMNAIEDKFSDTYTQMKRLEKMSSDIQTVIGLISDIASQTNLLALNASIEAARAGEQGKGFAVVAGEVGHLADQSKDAVVTIGSIITDVQNCINECVTLMGEGSDSVKKGILLTTEAQSSFEGIIQKIQKVSNEMTNVSAVTEEITSGTITLHEAITDISDISKSVAENTSSVSVAANDQKEMMGNVISEVDHLEKLCDNLKENLSVFKIED